MFEEFFLCLVCFPEVGYQYNVKNNLYQINRYAITHYSLTNTCKAYVREVEQL